MSRKLFSTRSRTDSSPAYASGIVSSSDLPGPVGGERVRRADSRDDVFSLGVGKELSIETLLAGRRVAGERHARRRAFPPVSEDHRLDVHGGTPVFGDAVETAVLLRAVVVPRPENSTNSAPQLFPRIVRKGRARVFSYELLVTLDDPEEILRGQVGIRRRALLDPATRQEFFEYFSLHLENDRGVHLEEPPAAVESEPFSGRRGKARDRRRRQAEIQDRVHHSRHGRSGAGADRDEKRVRGIAELPGRRLLEPREGLFDFRFEAFEIPGADVIEAHRGVDRESGRHRNSERRHLGQTRALPAPSFSFAEARAFGDAVAEKKTFFISRRLSQKSRRSS